MIGLEIDEESGASHFEILGISISDLEGLDDKALTNRVRDSAKSGAKSCRERAKAGDKEAPAMEARIRQAEGELKDKEKRKKYLEELQQGKAGGLDVLRVERTAPAFFWDRATRFRAITQALRDQGWTSSLMNDDTL